MRKSVIEWAIRATTTALIFEFARAAALFGCNVPILGRHRFALRFESSTVFECTHGPSFCPLMRFVFEMWISVCFRPHVSDFGLLNFCYCHNLPRPASRYVWLLCSQRTVFGAIINRS